MKSKKILVLCLLATLGIRCSEWGELLLRLEKCKIYWASDEALMEAFDDSTVRILTGGWMRSSPCRMACLLETCGDYSGMMSLRWRYILRRQGVGYPRSTPDRRLGDV